MQNTWAAWEQRALRFRVVQAKVRWFQEANILGLILHLPLMGLPDLPLPQLPGTQLFLYINKFKSLSTLKFIFEE